MRRFRSKAQSTLEYAFVVAIVAAAFLAMQYYVKRSVEGRIKYSADDIGEPYDSEDMAVSTMTTRVNSYSENNNIVIPMTNETYQIQSDVYTYSEVARNGNERINPW